MTDTNSLRTGAGYALEVGLYATHRAMIEAADTIDALRAQLAEAQRDADRYRAIRAGTVYLESPTDHDNSWYVCGKGHVRGEYVQTPDALDAAIDAAKGEPS